ncbi:hypothetical protein PybrP1_000076 [[Pythium] brassicae (nom. inval.)]|nr:hypothetical protein PybrP1_000076 [[Pythium] brassicae (nom. inval.)]
MNESSAWLVGLALRGLVVRCHRALAHLKLAEEVGVERLVRARDDAARVPSQGLVEHREVERLYFVELLEIDAADLAGEEPAVEEWHEETVLARHEATAEAPQRVVRAVGHLTPVRACEVQHGHSVGGELGRVESRDLAGLRLRAGAEVLGAAGDEEDELLVREPAHEAAQVGVDLGEVEVRDRAEVAQVHTRHEGSVRIELRWRRHSSSHVRDQEGVVRDCKASEPQQQRRCRLVRTLHRSLEERAVQSAHDIAPSAAPLKPTSSG